MRINNLGEQMDYWFNGAVVACPECGAEVEFGPEDIDKHKWNPIDGYHLLWHCPNTTCAVRRIKTTKNDEITIGLFQP